MEVAKSNSSSTHLGRGALAVDSITEFDISLESKSFNSKGKEPNREKDAEIERLRLQIHAYQVCFFYHASPTQM